MSDVKTDYGREELVALCEMAIVPIAQWHDRDSAGAQEQIGKAWALLRAGAEFKVRVRDRRLPEEATGCWTDDQTIWIDATWPGFRHFDWGGAPETDLFYIPTQKRLIERAGGDWY